MIVSVAISPGTYEALSKEASYVLALPAHRVSITSLLITVTPLAKVVLNFRVFATPPRGVHVNCKKAGVAPAVAFLRVVPKVSDGLDDVTLAVRPASPEEPVIDAAEITAPKVAESAVTVTPPSVFPAESVTVTNALPVAAE